MATIIHSINATVNGSCAHSDVVADAEHHAYASALLASADALLFSRNTFDLFAKFWPQAALSTESPDHIVAFDQQLGEVKKHVVSNRPLVTDWKNTFHLSGPLETALRNLRQSIRGNIVIFGSPGLATSLATSNQIDEYHVLFQPFIVNSQPRLFGSMATRRALRLSSVKPFASGVLLTKYQPVS